MDAAKREVWRSERDTLKAFSNVEVIVQLCAQRHESAHVGSRVRLDECGDL